jgi:ribose transport system ATP-binding protein
MDEALTAIDLLGIVPRAPDKPVGHLSGGNQQKVQLAKWLLGNARLMVVHEPTQGVDVGARRDIVEALVRLTATGVTVVVATMELELLEELCNRVAIFRDGRIDSIVDEVSVHKLIDTVYHVPSHGRGTMRDGQPESTHGGD